ncbi:DUF2441 domain-containing protein [Salmonella enterica subsp. houtenae]|uniref:DUF2441 domain-containing protein n=2 Tax=Salmonella houtenae TaxID=59205 RepID=A0A5Y6M580_SALHO|nr:DUF2441 domain-containing protein [Salmonella enterica subsp. enterica]EAO9681973.1 DUF2441 domain-containing protein [Salmonella enterica]EBF8289130.1 DUF2441 domain-containing protein [Salmonella enterica subsp. houtenae]EBQ5983918.1 DUF2441 domain-containing protein [Salmonella enterica subsp. houtenae serovar Houten]ECM3646379.1 DUF2441 domain-containing protein [Salmonella enterica subsp. enterica serovar Typhimurium]EDS4968230.1 DUF2441 domain-containing protein [Salmonella enterica s
MFKFFHADRAGTLSENSVIELNEDGLSYFGTNYSQYFGTPLHEHPANALREALLEIIREKSKLFAEECPSRYKCLFGALNVADAVQFARTIEPVPETDVRIFEVFANSYFIGDVNFIDAEPKNIERKAEYLKNYWLTKIYQGCYVSSPPRPPRLEVLLPLPVRVGEIVGIVPGITGKGAQKV